MRWNKALLVGMAAATLCAACTETGAGADAAENAGDGRVGAETPVDGAPAAAESAQLDLTTDAGRRAAFERLKGDYQTLRERLDGAAQDAKVLAADARRDGLRELQRLCDDLERRLDQLEDSGGEQWTKTRAQVLEHAERLRLECERVLGEERGPSPAPTR